MVVISTGTGPLCGFRILDLTNVVAGPIATLYLGMLGAEIIKIENPRNGGDVNRSASQTGDICNARFCTVNHNKRSIALDISRKEGREVFLKLVEKSDAVVENFRSGVMDHLGLGFEQLKCSNPHIVYGNISGFGSTGRLKDKAAYDVIAQAMSGVTMLSGEENDPPVKIGTSIGDVIAGINLALGVAAALRAAEKTGTPQRVEVALVDALVSALMMDNVDALNRNIVPPRVGNGYREWSPYGIYAAKDGFFALGTGTENHYRKLVTDVLNHPELLNDPRCSSQTVRSKNREVTEKHLTAWAMELSVNEVCQKLEEAGIPNAKVDNLLETDNNPHFVEERKLFPILQRPGNSAVKVTDIPIRFPGTYQAKLTPAPGFGEHCEEILSEFTDLRSEQIHELRRTGVII